MAANVQKTAHNQIFKYIQTLLKISWLTISIAGVALRLSCSKLGTKAGYTWSFTNPHEKTSSGVVPGDFASQTSEHFLQYVSLEWFLLKQTGWHMRFGEELYSACKQYFIGIVELLTGRWYLDLIVNSSDCFLNNEKLTYQTSGVHNSLDWILFAV